MKTPPLVSAPPVFETPAEAPAAEEPTLFNPFASPAEEPKAEEPKAEPESAPNPFAASEENAPNPFGAAEESASNPFGAAEESAPAPQAAAPEAPAAEEAPQWSPFGPTAEESQDAAAPAAAMNPFATPEPAPAGGEASPFGDAGGEGDNAFDLSAFGVSPEEAAEAAAEPAGDSELTSTRVFAIIKEPLADLVTEIKRSVDYFLGQSSEAAIDVVMLSGGTSRLTNLDQLLAGELGLPVVVSDPFQSVPVHSTQYPEEYLRQVAPLFTVAIGLGLRETVF